MKRTDNLQCDIQLSIIDVDHSPRYVKGFCEIYHATLVCEGRPDRSVVCKTIVNKKMLPKLRNEAIIYEHHLRHLQGQTVPICHGLFELELDPNDVDEGLTACLVLDYSGERLTWGFFDQNRAFKCVRYLVHSIPIDLICHTFLDVRCSP